MAWIEFHGAKIKRLKKFRDFRISLNWSVNEALGFLGSFWCEVIELAEDGDITEWTSEYICELTGVTLSPGRVWEALVDHNWIEQRTDGKVLVHDWLDTAKTYLTKKYNTSNRQKLLEIWSLHGRAYGSDQLETEQRPKRERTLPNQPNPTNQEEKDFPPEGVKDTPSSPRGGQKSKSAKAEGEATPHWREMIDHIDRIWFAKKRTKFFWEPKHFRRLKNLSKIIQPWGVMAMWEVYLSSNDDFARKSGYSMDVFFAQYARLSEDGVYKMLSRKYEEKLLGPISSELAQVISGVGVK